MNNKIVSIQHSSGRTAYAIKHASGWYWCWCYVHYETAQKMMHRVYPMSNVDKAANWRRTHDHLHLSKLKV